MILSLVLALAAAPHSQSASPDDPPARAVPRDGDERPASAPAAAPAARRARIRYRFSIDVPEGARSVDAWAPLPAEDAFQRIDDLRIVPEPQKRETERPHGNVLARFHWQAPLPPTLSAEIRFDLTRLEEGDHAPEPLADGLRTRFLEPDRLAVIDDRIRAIAKQATAGRSTTREQARALYDHVLGSMRYDKSGAGWGRGDSKFACDEGRGNCADFHSLFTSLARAAGIPARFHYGVSLKPDGTGGAHCWATFLDDATGWVPVDISEARKVLETDPEKARSYFGKLTSDRFLISTGRDLVLSPDQRGGALNFLDAPYVEIDGVARTAKVEVLHEPGEPR